MCSSALARGRRANWKALMHACKEGNELVVRYVLDKFSNVSVNQAAKNAWTPLISALWNKEKMMARLLLDHVGQYSETPLWVASYFGHTRIMKLLLRHPGMELNKENLFTMSGKRFSKFAFKIIDLFLFLLFSCCFRGSCRVFCRKI